MGYKTQLVLMNDFDGNVLNTMEAHGRLAADCMNQCFGMPKDEAEEKYHATTGISFDKQLGSIFQGYEKRFRDACAAEYHRRKIREVYKAAELFPEIKEILPELKRYGFPILINTGTETDVTSALLKRHGILTHFDAVWGTEYGVKSDHIKRADELWVPRRIVFTGDSGKDVELSKIDEDKIITVGRTGKGKGMLSEAELRSAGATHVITSFEELPAIIKLYS